MLGRKGQLDKKFDKRHNLQWPKARARKKFHEDQSWVATTNGPSDVSGSIGMPGIVCF
jgi:hypothetical protein